MSYNLLYKIVIACLVISLILTITGISDPFNILPWEILAVSLLLAIVNFNSRRYYWGSIFAIFAILFNPWVRLPLPRTGWVFTDILLAGSLIYWSLDYFRNYHKGLLFERFVLNKFPKPTYTLVSTTKDLSKKLRRFVESDTNPDFVFRENRIGGNPKSPKKTALLPIEIIQKQYFKFIPKKIIEQYSLTSLV